MREKTVEVLERVRFGERIPLEHVLKGTGQHLLGALGSIDWRDEAKRVRLLQDVRNRLLITLRLVDEWLEARGR
jgi:hypothetical protein